MSLVGIVKFVKGAPCLLRVVAYPRWLSDDGATGEFGSVEPSRGLFIRSKAFLVIEKD